jgi:hypothetical protein
VRKCVNRRKTDVPTGWSKTVSRKKSTFCGLFSTCVFLNRISLSKKDEFGLTPELRAQGWVTFEELEEELMKNPEFRKLAEEEFEFTMVDA